MGSSVGLCVGLVFGGWNILKYGPGSNGFARTLGKTMLGSAATFGFFMAIGTTIRTESNHSQALMANYKPIEITCGNHCDE